MPLYKAKFRKKDGTETFAHVEAGDEDAALKALNLSRSSVISIKRDFMEELDRKLPKSSPPLDVQARTISIFTAKVASGLNPSVTLDRTVAAIPQLAPQLAEVEKVHKVSEKLEVLRFDPQLRLLAAVGEQSGLVAQTLGSAADELIERTKILGEIKKQVIPSIGIAVLGILTMLILPLFMVEPIKSVMNARGLTMKVNFCTDILLFFGDLMKGWLPWVVFVAGIIGISLTSKLWWPYVRDLPGFRFIEGYFKVQNAYRFVSAFLPLFSRGVQLAAAMEMLRHYSSGSTEKVYARMLDHLKSGGALSNAFEDRYWDDLLRDLMKGFDEMKQTSKEDLLRRMQPLMAQSMAKTGQKLGTTLNMFGLFTSLATTMIVFMGLTIPLMTVSAKF